MKNILWLVIFILSTIQTFSQAEDQNFILSDSKIIWQKVYKTNKSKDELIKYFKESEIFSLFKVENNQIIAQLKPHHTDPKKTGVAGVPPLINKTDFIGLVVIDFKEKEKMYRVTFSNINIVGKGELLSKGEKQTFEENFLRKGVSAYRPFFLVKPCKIYNTTFTEIFTIKSKTKVSW